MPATARAKCLGLPKPSVGREAAAVSGYPGGVAPARLIAGTRYDHPAVKRTHNPTPFDGSEIERISPDILSSSGVLSSRAKPLQRDKLSLISEPRWLRSRGRRASGYFPATLAGELPTTYWPTLVPWSAPAATENA